MKIQTGNENRIWNIQVAGLGKNDSNEVKNGSVFLGKKQDDWQQTKLKIAQKQAMHVVASAHKNEAGIDDQVKGLHDQEETLKEENNELNQKIKDIKKQRDAVLEDAGLTEEDKDTEEYKSLASSYNDEIEMYYNDISKNEKVIAANAQAGYKVDIERLKSHAMVDAAKQKDEMMTEAAKNFAFGSMQEAMTEVEEKMQETVEKAKEKAAEKAEEEEKAAERAEETEQDGTVSEHTPFAPVPDTSSTGTQEDIQRKLKEIADNMNILQEDLKGIAVDQVG